MTRHFTLGHQSSSSKPSGFQSLLDCEAHPPAQSHLPSTSSLDAADAGVDEKDCILSQDFFCTPDYITPDAPAIPNAFNNETVSFLVFLQMLYKLLQWIQNCLILEYWIFLFLQDNLICPQSPEKIRTVGSKMRSLGNAIFCLFSF
nr:wee1-like protein kinase [Ipomoea batatas]